MPHLDRIALWEDTHPLLATRAFGRVGRAYATVTSTNTLARQWANAGAPHGAVVLAEYQRAGRGRQGRRWESTPGHNLMFSLILRPMASQAPFGLLPLAAALAVVEAIAPEVAPHPPSIKWPNDILLEGRKCCGMLAEGVHQGAETNAIIVGLGLNVNQDTFPAPLHDTATSLRLVTGRLHPRPPLLAGLLAHLEYWLGRWSAGQSIAIRKAYTYRMALRGAPVTLTHTGDHTPHRGVVRGIDPEGALLLETAGGLQSFHAGDVTSHPLPTS